MSNISRHQNSLPVLSSLLGEEEFLRLTGLEPERLADLLQLDWLDHTDTENATLFRGRDVYRASWSVSAAISGFPWSEEPSSWIFLNALRSWSSR